MLVVGLSQVQTKSTQMSHLAAVAAAVTGVGEAALAVGVEVVALIQDL